MVKNKYLHNSLIFYDNKINEISWGNLSYVQLRMLIVVFSKLSQQNTLELVMSYDELRTLAILHNSDGSVAMKRTLKAFYEALLQVYYIEKTENGGYRGANMIISFDFDHDPLRMTISPEFFHYFNQKFNEFGQFTIIEFNNFFKLKSKNSQLLYMKLRQYRRKGLYIVRADDLARYLGREGSPFWLLSRDNLRVAIEELSAFFMNLNYRKIGSGEGMLVEFHFDPIKAEKKPKNEKTKTDNAEKTLKQYQQFLHSNEQYDYDALCNN